jgi:hypothetical protein
MKRSGKLLAQFEYASGYKPVTGMAARVAACLATGCDCFKHFHAELASFPPSWLLAILSETSARYSIAPLQEIVTHSK